MMFQRFVEALPPTLAPRVVSYPTDERRGYLGLEPIVEAQLPDGPFAIVAESFGGPLALRIAAKRPRGLAALVLVATFVHDPVPWWMRRARFLLGRTFFSVTPPAIVLRALLTGADASDELVAEFQDSIRAVHPAILAARVREVLDVDARSHLVDCNVPILYVEAKKEALLRGGIARELAVLKPEVELASLPSPHLVLQRCPHEAAALVASFLERTVPGREPA
jgi:pimeloyl-ACP methyl ester carboxylesterase